MNKLSTWLAIIAAIVYSGAYYYARQNFDTQYTACVKTEPALEQYCSCKRDTMLDEVSIYRVITTYSREMERVRKFSGTACYKDKVQPPRK